MKAPTESTLPFDLDKLFQEARPELEAIDPSAFVRRHVVRARVVELTDTLLHSFGPLAGSLDAVLAPKEAKQRKLEFARLHERAWVFYAADLAAEERRADTGRIRRRALAKVVVGHDRFLLKWATPVFGDDPVHAETLQDIARGVGWRDDAEDVLRLVALFREHWDVVGSEVPAVSEALLDQAATDATTQLGLLRDAGRHPLRNLADAAYALWYRDYDELMWLGRYLSRREADALERFPGVRTAVSRRVGDEEEDDEFDDALGEDDEYEEDDDDAEADAEAKGDADTDGDAAAQAEDPHAAA